MFLSFVLCFTLIQFSYLNDIISPTIPCSSFSDCFNCSATSHCYWQTNNQKCNDLNKTKYVVYWWNAFENCTDPQSTSISNEYCGELNLTELLSEQSKKKETLTLLLPVYKNNFTVTNIHCAFNIINIKKDETIIIQSNKKCNETSWLKLTIFAHSIDKSGLRKDIHNIESYNGSFTDINKIHLYYFASQNFMFQPFDIVLYKETKKKKYGIYIGIGILILFIIVLTISVVFLITKVKNNKKKNSTISSINHNSINEQDEHATLRMMNLKKIDLLFRNEFSPERYSQQKEKYGKSCSICLNNFRYGNQVTKTFCGHLFHYKCIKNWLVTNVMNPKCPNCNSNVLEVSEKKKGKKVTRSVVTSQYMNTPFNNSTVLVGINNAHTSVDQSRMNSSIMGLNNNNNTSIVKKNEHNKATISCTSEIINVQRSNVNNNNNISQDLTSSQINNSNLN